MFRLRLGNLLGLTAVFALLCRLLPNGVSYVSAWGFLCWTLAILAQVHLAEWSRIPVDWDDSTRDDAFELSRLIGKGAMIIWAGFVLLLMGLLISGTKETSAIDQALKLIAIPAALWLPVCLYGNILSLLLYFEWRDTPLLSMRLNSLFTVLIPLAWFVAEST